LGVNPYLKTVLQGTIIVLAVASYTLRSKKEAV
jgi:ABC-type glucose/galactose transport system permease subunit